jgi:hypothetical protein
LRGNEFPKQYQDNWAEQLAYHLFDTAYARPSFSSLLSQMLDVLEFLLAYRYLLLRGCEAFGYRYSTDKPGIRSWHQRAHFLSRALKAFDKKFHDVFKSIWHEERRQTDINFVFHLVGPPHITLTQDVKAECFHALFTDSHSCAPGPIFTCLEAMGALRALALTTR